MELRYVVILQVLKREMKEEKNLLYEEKTVSGFNSAEIFFSSGFNIKGRKKKNPSNALVFIKGKEADAI